MNTKTKKRYKMSMPSFIFMSIIGIGFALKSIVNQYTQFGNFTWLMFLLTIIFYAIPFVLIIFEFVSLKRTKGSESGYQSWMSTIFTKKWGFIAGFFYFFVNIFWFLDLVPSLINYSLYAFIGEKAVTIIERANAKTWAKILISLISIILFWIGTFVSTKGPKWLSKVAKVVGGAGLIITIIFIFAAIIHLILGNADNSVSKNMILYNDEGKVINDITWEKLGSVAWGLQAMGGLESMASYKNDFKGGEKDFRRAMTYNVMIFSTLFMAVSILLQFIYPADKAAVAGLLSSIYGAFSVMGFGSWWTHVVGIVLMLTALGSLLLWTSAPTKILFSDAPKNIFGKRFSKLDHNGTPINALILQACIVSVLFIFQMLGTLSAGANEFLGVIKKLNGGAATIPVIFMGVAFIKLRFQSDKPKHERTFYAFGKNKWIAFLAVIPLIAMFVMATLTGLIPSAQSFRENTSQAVVSVILGPVGILLAYLFCEIIYRRWERKNKKINNK